MAEQEEFESTEQELDKVRGFLGDTVELFRRSTDEWSTDAKGYRERIVELEREANEALANRDYYADLLSRSDSECGKLAAYERGLRIAAEQELRTLRDGVDSMLNEQARPIEPWRLRALLEACAKLAGEPSAAEQELQRLRDGVSALADEYEHEGLHSIARELRKLLEAKL